MLKIRHSKKSNIFRKKKLKNLKLFLKEDSIYKKNGVVLSMYNLDKWLKKTYKRFKKRRLKLFLNVQSNLIRTFKSKNARMGKGKGQLKRYTIWHINRRIGRLPLTPPLIKSKMLTSFLKMV